MSDIDLVPASFRRRREQRRILTVSGMGTAALAVLALAAAGVLLVMDERTRARTAELTTEQQAQLAQQDRLAALSAQRVDLQRQRNLLEELRRGAAAGRLFQVVEATLPHNQVWLSEWTFAREGETLQSGPQAQPPDRYAYLIVIPAGPADSSDETRAIRTSMVLRGEATDHAALSRFVGAMVRRPEVAEVRVLRTTARQRQDLGVVGFTLSVVVSPDVEALAAANTDTTAANLATASQGGADGA